MSAGRAFPLLVLLTLGCNRNASAPGNAPATAEPTTVSVKTTTPKSQAMGWSAEVPASILPYQSTPVAARIPGYVKELAPEANAKRPDTVIDMGSEVGPGQLLAVIAAPEVVARASEKAAAVEVARAARAGLDSDWDTVAALIVEAESKVKEAEAGVARAEADVTRWTAQLTYEVSLTGTIDEQARDITRKQLAAAKAMAGEANARVRSAAAAVAERRARWERTAAEVQAAQARVRLAEAQAAEANADVAYTRITAPFAGVVSARMIHPGHLVQPGTVLFTVTDLSKVRVTVDVPEAGTARIVAEKTQAVVRVPALDDREFRATITRSAGVVRPDSRTLRVEIEIENPKRELKPGMYASVRIEAGPADATVLPTGAIMTADETHYAFLVEGGKAIKYEIRVGQMGKDVMQVVGRRRTANPTAPMTPLTGSEKVIVGNLGALADGVAVEVAD